MPRTIRNEYYKKLNYENLMKAHLESRKGKACLDVQYARSEFLWL